MRRATGSSEPGELTVVGVGRAVEQGADVDGERSHRADAARHRQQQSTHVWVLGDGGAVGATGHGPLQTGCGVGGGLLVGALCKADALVSHAEAGGVHHDEHAGESAADLADQVAGRTVVGEHAGRAAVDAELVLDRHGRHGVACAE